MSSKAESVSLQADIMSRRQTEYPRNADMHVFSLRRGRWRRWRRIRLTVCVCVSSTFCACISPSNPSHKPSTLHPEPSPLNPQPGSQTGAVAKMAEERAIEAEEELDAAHGAAEEAEEAR